VCQNFKCGQLTLNWVHSYPSFHLLCHLPHLHFLVLHSFLLKQTLANLLTVTISWCLFLR
jgi:hypothetical protein